jgi:toxin HigB-1
VIQSFADSVTEKVWNREQVRKLGHDLQRMAHRRLRQLNAAGRLDDLRIPTDQLLQPVSR